MIAFRLFNTPVRVQPFFLLIAVYFGHRLVADDPAWATKILVWVAVMFTGVLAHEFGHAFAGRAFGLVPRIELHGLGGLTSWEGGGRRLSPGRSMIVSAAGPLVGIGIGLPCLLVWAAIGLDGESLLGFTLSSLVFVNLGWGLLNLIPMMPLDGGNLMASFLELFAQDRGRLLARYFSLLLAAGLLAFAVASMDVWLMVLVGFLGFMNFRGLQAERRIGPDLGLASELRDIAREIDSGALRDAQRHARELRDKARTPLVRREAQRLVAWSAVLSGDPGSARVAVASLAETSPPDALLEGTVRLASGNTQEVEELLARALAVRDPSAERHFVRAVAANDRWAEAADLLGVEVGKLLSSEALEQLEEGAYRAGAYEAAATTGMILFEREKDALRAFNIACSLTRAGRPDDAMRWLGEARDAGMEHAHLLDSDEDLGPLRERPDWAALRETFS